MSDFEYANLEVNKVVLHANTYSSDDAVPKSYVDQGGTYISQALDTLKEIGSYLTDNTVAQGLVQHYFLYIFCIHI